MTRETREEAKEQEEHCLRSSGGAQESDSHYRAEVDLVAVRRGPHRDCWRQEAALLVAQAIHASTKVQLRSGLPATQDQVHQALAVPEAPQEVLLSARISWQAWTTTTRYRTNRKAQERSTGSETASMLLPGRDDLAESSSRLTRSSSKPRKRCLLKPMAKRTSHQTPISRKQTRRVRPRTHSSRRSRL